MWRLWLIWAYKRIEFLGNPLIFNLWTQHSISAFHFTKIVQVQQSPWSVSQQQQNKNKQKNTNNPKNIKLQRSLRSPMPLICLTALRFFAQLPSTGNRPLSHFRWNPGKYWKRKYENAEIWKSHQEIWWTDFLTELSHFLTPRPSPFCKGRMAGVGIGQIWWDGILRQ